MNHFESIWYTVLMLYTGKGDKGTSKLFNSKDGERVSKSDDVFEALGSLDELNSFLGLCRAYVSDANYTLDSQRFFDIVFKLQQDLFIVQAELAGASMSIDSQKVEYLEWVTNTAEKLMPPITTFFIPGASKLGAYFDTARTISRRVERAVIRAKEGGVSVSDFSLAYLNRLPSALYALARLSNHFSGITETPPTYK